MHHSSLALLLAFPVLAQDTLDPHVQAAAEAALVLGAEADAARLYDLAILEQGHSEALIDWLEVLSDGGTGPAAYLLARLYWRSGDLDAARAALKPLVEQGGGPGMQLDYARLLDAVGWEDEAVAAYHTALEAGPEAGQDPERERWLRLRLALMTMEQGEEQRDALAELARVEGQPIEFRNRAAIVLALLGRPADAVSLYVPTEQEGTPLFRDLVRLAEWAVVAEDAPAAQDFAWRASLAAALTRDRAYALAVLVEAYRLDDSLDALAVKLASTEDLPEAHRARLLELLRDLDRTDEAIELFSNRTGDELGRDQRRELLQMFRDAGQEERMVAEYEALIVAEPRAVLWREGLARFYLENGDRERALLTWRPFVDEPVDGDTLAGAEALMGLSLDELAVECAEKTIAQGQNAFPALLFLYGLHSDRGRLLEAQAALERLDSSAPADHGVRMDLAEAFERLGLQERALEVFVNLGAARSQEEPAEDMAMRLAWLYSEVGREDEAMDAWLVLWERVQSIPRRRYVEDRLMTVASRLGRLADVAIELERKLYAGTANARESGLLVRLYTKVGDSVSATEVIEEFMKQTGGGAKDLLEEKARVYVACTDYARYEDTVRALMELDPENEGEYLRQLAMSMLERGKPDEARAVLSRLKQLEAGSEADEFEAGVLALAGMRKEAISAYRTGIARHPDRIDSLLLLANVMKDVGQTSDAIGMFQYMMETAEQDDLFTVAVDGLLNMEAPADTLRWARRIVLERLAGREGKMYLFQLYSDLSEELDDKDGQFAALENSLPIAGTRRPSILRELMDLSAASTGPFGRSGGGGDDKRQLAYGRRLIGLSELVPPQVYLDLGESFLRAGEIKNAAKTFHLASDQPDYARVQRQAAGLFDEQGYPAEALGEYERVLVSQATDVGLMAKVAELCEQLGQDSRAAELYVRAMELLHQRRPLRTGKAEDEDESKNVWWRARNLDDYDSHHLRVRTGLLATIEPERAPSLIEAERQAALDDLAELEAGVGDGQALEALVQHPRLLRRSQHHRHLALAFGDVAAADAFDRRLLGAFPMDEDLLEELVQARVKWGLVGSARTLIEDSGRPDEQRRKLRFLVGEGSADDAARQVPLVEGTRLLLPPLVAGNGEAAEALLRRIDVGSVTKEELPGMQVLFSAAQYLGNPGLTLSLGRQWVRLKIKHGTHQYELEPILDRVGAALPEQERLAFYQYFVSLILEDPDKAASFIPMLPKLQSIFESPLLSAEQIAELLDGYGENGYGWGLGPVLGLLPPDERAGALRSVWSKIQATGRASFLMQLVNEMSEPLGDGLALFIGDAFEGALVEADDFYRYRVRQLWDEEQDLELVERMRVALLAKAPRDWNVRALDWILKWRRGEIEAAVAAAAEVYVDSLDAPEGEYDARNARNRVHLNLLPDHLEALLAAFDAATGERKSTVELTLSRIELVERAGDEGATLAAYLKAVELFPEEVDLLKKLRGFYQGRGRLLEALEVLQRIAELEPEKRSWQRQLKVAWLELRNPALALAAYRRMQELPEDDDEDSGIPGLPAGFVLPPGSIIIINGVRYTGGQTGQRKDDRRQKPANIKTVYEAAEQQHDDELARRTLRRLWRDFKKGEQSDPYGFRFFGWGYGRLAQLNWPESADKEEEAEVSLGGLADFREEEPEEKPEALNAWEVLAGREWGAAEMLRFARTFEPREVDGYQPFFEGLLKARLAQEQPAQVMDELLGAVSGQTGGRVEQVLLLSLLDLHPELADGRVRSVLDELIGAANPIDGQQVRRLARMYSREGRTTEAVRLYRWCATQTSSVMRFATDGPTPLDPSDLVKEAKDELEGEARDAVVEAILTFADPGKARWQRESFETLALSTWAEMYGPQEALIRGRAMCEASIDPSTGLRRRSAKAACWLFARAGETDKALIALEFAAAKLDPDLFTNVNDPWARLWPKNFGYLSHADLKKLFPSEVEGSWPERADWYRAAAEHLAGWIDEERVNVQTGITALAILTRRLVALEDVDGARIIARGLLEQAGSQDLNPSQLLWVADAAREAGLRAEADGIELRLLELGSLQVERVPAVIRRQLEAEGPERALALGLPAAERIQHPDLLELLAGACETLGDEPGAEAWRTRALEAEVAKNELEAALEADKTAR
jgi:tetratricopeptide (TPR) repeat protein